MCVGGRATINALSRSEGSYALDDKELDIFILQFDSQNLGYCPEAATTCTSYIALKLPLLVPHILPEVATTCTSYIALKLPLLAPHILL